MSTHLLARFDRETRMARTWCGVEGEMIRSDELLTKKTVLHIARTMAMTDCVHCRGNKRADPETFRSPRMT